MVPLFQMLIVLAIHICVRSTAILINSTPELYPWYNLASLNETIQNQFQQISRASK